MMMNELIRRPDPQSSYSPKSSPRGSRSPVVPRQDSTGTLKTTISLGKAGPAIVHSGPFYLMKAESPAESELTGATNLIVHHNLEHSYNKFCLGRKAKDQLSAFLPNLPGIIDAPPDDPSSTLRSLIEKPPITGKEIIPLTSSQLTGFRLHPGPLPEKYRLMHTPTLRKKHKHKKSKSRGTGDMSPSQEGSANDGLDGSGFPGHDKNRHRDKKRKHDDEKERKKKKKEKKKKKQKHSPEQLSSASGASGLLPSGPTGSSGSLLTSHPSDRSV